MVDIHLQEGGDALVRCHDELVLALVITLPRSKGHLTTNTDACDKQGGCVLMQEQLEGTKTQLSYGSRTLNAAGQNYGTTHRKGLAAV